MVVLGECRAEDLGPDGLEGEVAGLDQYPFGADVYGAGVAALVWVRYESVPLRHSPS